MEGETFEREKAAALALAAELQLDSKSTHANDQSTTTNTAITPHTPTSALTTLQKTHANLAHITTQAQHLEKIAENELLISNEKKAAQAKSAADAAAQRSVLAKGQIN